MEEIIRKYFKAWIDKDADALRGIFSEDAVYSECWGPEYHGAAQILQWFSDWNTKGDVLEWTIKRTMAHERTLVAEWYFKCSWEGSVDGFDGVTIADFDDDGRIVRLCEYKSDPEHYLPYGE